MSFLATYSSALQVIVAFLIFAVGHLAALLCILISLALAEFTLEGTGEACTHLVTVPLSELRLLLLRGN
jgi:hypothetical protein